MNKTSVYLILGVALLALGGSAWFYFSSSSSIIGGDRGNPLVCTYCGHYFTITDEQVYTHPKDPNGAGFKCEKCGKFGARVAVQCDNCKKWFNSQSRGASCPYCKGGTPGGTPAQKSS